MRFKTAFFGESIPQKWKFSASVIFFHFHGFNSLLDEEDPSSELKPQKWKKIAEAENFHFCGIDSPKKAVLNLNYAGVFLDSGKLHTTILLMF